MGGATRIDGKKIAASVIETMRAAATALEEEAGVKTGLAVVIGRSNLFGKPMAQLLLNANATVTTAHSRTKDLPGVCRNADILVAAVGRAELVKVDWVKMGATVIDVGINRVDAPERGEGMSRLVGDVAYEEVSGVAGAITPVPGGVGPMTIAMLDGQYGSHRLSHMRS